MRAPLPADFLAAPIAHRGLHDKTRGVIENSLSAVRAALAHGYGIEMDLQLSRDGVAMVFHDDTLDRLTEETGPLRDRSAAELGRIRLKGSQDTIPTFAQVLAEVAGRVPLLVEIKDQSLVMSDTDGRLEAAAASDAADYPGPLAFMSFNPHSVAHLARLAPQIPRGLTTCGYDLAEWAPMTEAMAIPLRAIADYDRTEASFISHDATDLARPRVAALKAQGAHVLCWTIRSPQAEAEARRIAENVTFEGYLAAHPA